MSRQMSDPALVNLVASQGWATKEEKDEIVVWIRDWGERPMPLWRSCIAPRWDGTRSSIGLSRQLNHQRIPS